VSRSAGAIKKKETDILEKKSDGNHTRPLTGISYTTWLAARTRIKPEKTHTHTHWYLPVGEE